MTLKILMILVIAMVAVVVIRLEVIVKSEPTPVLKEGIERMEWVLKQQRAR